MFEIPGAPIEVLLFGLIALTAIVGAISVVISSDPFMSALALLTNFASLGTLYLFLDSPFVAVAQVIVYAGAVVVLFLFVMAYLGDRREVLGAARRMKWMLIPAALVSLALLALICGVVSVAEVPAAAGISNPADTQFGFGTAQAVGEVFLTRYLLEFEVTSLVLLVAAIGGIVLGLTGRSRQAKLRAELGTHSADRQRRGERDQRRALRHAEVRAAEEQALAATAGNAATSTKGTE